MMVYIIRCLYIIIINISSLNYYYINAYIKEFITKSIHKSIFSKEKEYRKIGLLECGRSSYLGSKSSKPPTFLFSEFSNIKKDNSETPYKRRYI